MPDLGAQSESGVTGSVVLFDGHEFTDHWRAWRLTQRTLAISRACLSTVCILGFEVRAGERAQGGALT